MPQRNQFIFRELALNKLLVFRSRLIIIFSLSAISLATLYPFSFDLYKIRSIEQFINIFRNPTYLYDQVQNILLFMPVGFGFAGLWYKKKLPFIIKLVQALLVSACLTSIVELLQAFLPSRDPTPDDVIYNSLGGVVGFLCFYLWQPDVLISILKLIDKYKSRQLHKVIAVFLVTYVALIWLICTGFQAIHSFNSWDGRYNLALGNENAGDRPWQGYISEVHIADRAISPTEVERVFTQPDFFPSMGKSLLAAYDFAGKENQTDTGGYQDKTGQTPDLLWQGKSFEPVDSKGVFLQPEHWLKTDTAVTAINNRLKETSELTFSATMAADGKQQEFGVIASISKNKNFRNFSLIQNGNNLVIRLRTIVNGYNGNHFELSIDDVFADRRFHHLVFTYSRSVVRVYIDGVARSYRFNYMEWMPLDEKFLYYGLSFFPLGICLGLMTVLINRKLVLSGLLLAVVMLMSAVVVDVILAGYGDRGISEQNLVMSVLSIAIAIAILKLRMHSKLIKKYLYRIR